MSSSAPVTPNEQGEEEEEYTDEEGDEDEEEDSDYEYDPEVSQMYYDSAIHFIEQEIEAMAKPEDFLKMDHKYSHMAAIHLDEISNLPPDFLKEVLTKDVPSTLFMYLCLFSLMVDTDDDDEFLDTTCVVSFACKDCNLVYDTPLEYPEGHELEGTGASYHCEIHSHKDVKDFTGGAADFEDYLHQTTLFLQLLNAVLSSCDLKASKELNQLENQLLMRDVKSRSAMRMHSLKFFGDDSRVMDPNALPLVDFILHFLHTKNDNFPLLAQNLSALLSLLVMRRPAAVLAPLTQDQFVCAIGVHLTRINRQSFGDLSAMSIRFSNLSYLNIFPTLWHMTPMNAAQIAKFKLEEDVTNLMVRWMAHTGKAMICARGGCPCYVVDNPIDYKEFPSLIRWECPVRDFFFNPDMVKDHPLRLAFVATAELLTKWRQWGLPIAKHLHDEYDDNPEMLLRLMSAMETIGEMNPTLAHGHSLFKDLLEDTHCAEEYTSVVRASKQIRCHYPSCHKKKGLQGCTGCNTAFYCCVDHQTLDWKTHKRFCKSYKKSASEPLSIEQLLEHCN